MIVTEEEAKTKRCQESFASHGGYADARPDEGRDVIIAPRNCIGSACMAWRWHWPEFDAPSQERGYCGKAGKL